jgi:DNA-binding NtrC family response regulator
MSYDWRRNNVRELRNILERMLIASDADEIGVADVPPEIRNEGAARRVSTGASPETFHELKAEAERQIVIAALGRHDWHITRTAEALGLADHASLLKIMRRHGISRD